MKSASRLYFARFASPLGELGLYATDKALVALTWPRDTAEPGRVRLFSEPENVDNPVGHPLLATAARELAEYFSGGRRSFDLPLSPRGTEFQLAVWAALRAIPYGATTSYGELASRLGRPTAARAVGAAVGKNPISIIVPCHRVLGAKGELTGFAGGIEAKRYLLELEARKPVAAGAQVSYK